MRPAGFTLAALLVGVSAAWAQQPGTPAAPPGRAAPPQPPAAPAAPAADPKLDAHLAGWEKTMGGVQNFRFELALTRKDAAFQKARDYTGVVLGLKPNYAILRLDYAADKTGKDYEAFISDGKMLYFYNGPEKTITRAKLPDPAANPAGQTGNLMLDFLSGMKSQEIKQRFDISLFKEDKDGFYIYMDVKPVLGRDKEEFQQLRMALYGPNTKFTYLPAQVYLVKPNGDTEMWSFKNPQTNLPGIDSKVFAFKPVPGFTERDAQPAGGPAPPGRPMNPTLPGGTGLPPGPGSVRPDKQP